MSRYEMTQEQLDVLREQIKQLSRLNEAKEERIKDLERFKVRISGSDTFELLSTISRQEDEIHELKNLNKQLLNEKMSNLQKIKNLELVLNEEKKLREYSENFAKQAELQCAEESLILKLTTELCQLQKDEIEIENKRILDLQKKIKKLTAQINVSDHSGNSTKNDHLKSVINQLQSQFLNLHKQINSNPLKTAEEQKQSHKLEKWMGEIGNVVEDLNDMQEIRKDLNYLKNQIEGRRRKPYIDN